MLLAALGLVVLAIGVSSTIADAGHQEGHTTGPDCDKTPQAAACEKDDLPGNSGNTVACEGPAAQHNPHCAPEETTGDDDDDDLGDDDDDVVIADDDDDEVVADDDVGGVVTESDDDAAAPPGLVDPGARPLGCRSPAPRNGGGRRRPDAPLRNDLVTTTRPPRDDAGASAPASSRLRMPQKIE